MKKINDESLDLDLEQLDEIRRILSTHIPEITVWAFGSRVSGKARNYSDLDLALITTEPLSLSLKADLVACFEESDLPFKVDLVDWASASDKFREIIKANKIVLQ